MAELGTDKSSIRWTDYIKPAYGEAHTFTIRLNGGVRLWIGNKLQTDALVANQLVPIKIEYTKSNADAMIQLLFVAEYFAAACKL
eukprot:scaffold78424_cov39-Cyclotella_meneghiniana.AAC.4